MKVYCVFESGSDTFYQELVGIFSTRRKAGQFICSLHDDDPVNFNNYHFGIHIEELEVDEYAVS